MTEVLIGGQLFPDKCPDGCPEKGESFPFYQGNICSRCPIFNCTPLKGDPEFTLIRPEDYRPDWALEWKKWLDNDMKGIPKLVLRPKPEV